MTSANDHAPIIEAVLLFKNAAVAEHMLYSEFEGVLDHVSSLPEYADETVKGCFVHVNMDLQIEGLVFFCIDFDEKGYADRSWSIPLRRLMSNAGYGPDLGAGPIRLVCRTRCSMPELREELWDPSIQPGMNHFQILKMAILRNDLNINSHLALSSKSGGCIDVAIAPTENTQVPLMVESALGDQVVDLVNAVNTCERISEVPVLEEEQGSDAVNVTSPQVEPPVIEPEASGTSEMSGTSESTIEEQQKRDKLAEVIKTQRFRIESLMNECDDKVAQIERARRHDQIQFNEYKQMLSEKFERLKLGYAKNDERLNNSVALISRLIGCEDTELIKTSLEDLRAIGNLADLSVGETTEQMELIQTKAENYLLTQQMVQMKRAYKLMSEKLKAQEAHIQKIVKTDPSVSSKAG